MYTIFIVEDDRALRDELMILLKRNGYDVLTSERYERMVEEIIEGKPDLVLLDLTLPLIDGQIICREVRKLSALPIMIVTSRDDDMDELVCLNLGADAFITKPYNTQILLAHIASLLRRVYDSGDERLLSCGGVVLDTSRSLVVHQNKTVELTKNELRILHLLMSYPETIVSRIDLMDALWQSNEFIDDNTLTVNINRLRRKLESVDVAPDFLQTKRGLGYLVAP